MYQNGTKEKVLGGQYADHANAMDAAILPGE
jgi:hypothetical protein